MPDIDKTIPLADLKKAPKHTAEPSPAAEPSMQPESPEQPRCARALEESDMPLRPLGETCRKVNEFASGGQGILSQGIDLSLHRTLAVKTLREELATDAEKRRAFIREARITAQLEHPAIIPVHSLHRDGKDTLAVTMKLLHGQDLHTYLDKLLERYEKEGFSASIEEDSRLERLEIFLKICDALEYAHSRNIMHCDLKPANIMLGEYHDAYLMDWGLAHPIRNEEFAPGKPVPKSSIAGTPKYIAPETFLEKYSDQRADIYSMGIILFELITLRPAIPELTTAEMLRLVCEHKLQPVEHLYGYPVDADIRAIIVKATEYEPERRYQNISELSADIRRYLQREEVSARPDNLYRKLFRSCIIHHGKALVIITLACLLAMVCLAAFTLYRQLKEEHLEKVLNRAVGIKFIECQEMADQLDHELVEMAHNLADCTRTFNLLLDKKLQPELDGPAGQYAVPYLNYQDVVKAPASFLKNDRQGIRLDFAHTGYRLLDEGLPEEDAALFPLQAAAMLPHLQDTLMASQFDCGVLGEKNRPALLKSLPFSRLGANLVYFATLDGRHLVYPGKAYDGDYDPRKRQWFTDRIASGTASGWSAPYLNYNETGLVMSYTIRMDDANGHTRGVAALDLDVSCLLDFVFKREKPGAGLMEKCFLNDRGEVISTTDDSFEMMCRARDGSEKKGGATGRLYPQRALLNLMKQTSKGYLEMNVRGRKCLYIFAKCRTVNWFYLERIDLESISLAEESEP